MKRTLNNLMGLILLAASVCGCAGYRLGSMLPPDIKTVHVPTFINRTTEPMIEVDTTSATIRQLQQDGSLTLAGNEEADAILIVVLTDYSLEPLAYSTLEKTTADEYRIRIRALAVLKRRSNDQVLVENASVTGESTFFIEGDFTSSKQRGLPEASKDLGRKIVEQIVEAW